MRRTKAALLAIAALGAVAAAVAAAGGRRAAAEAQPVETEAALPARLADTGLYADFATKTIAPGVLPFSPQYPLWTDGAKKSRWIRLPAGTTIDASDPDAWQFPVGTRLWKEFAFERRIETRMLERMADGSWRYATYAWTEDGRDALLAPANGIRGATESRPGVRYDVPGRADCRICHEGRPTPVLGFSTLQLSPDRDPLALHAEAARPGDVDLRVLVARGLVRGLAPSIVDDPPRIAAATPRARAALGYLHANCGICHTASDAHSPIAPLRLFLDAPAPSWAGRGSEPAPAVETTVGRASRFRFRDAGGDLDTRVVPGDPSKSVLWRRLASRRPLSQMPPLGTHLADAEAVALIEQFIREDLAEKPASSATSDPATASPAVAPQPLTPPAKETDR